jgi:hypothetical protein
MFTSKSKLEEKLLSKNEDEVGVYKSFTRHLSQIKSIGIQAFDEKIEILQSLTNGSNADLSLTKYESMRQKEIHKYVEEFCTNYLCDSSSRMQIITSIILQLIEEDMFLLRFRPEPSKLVSYFLKLYIVPYCQLLENSLHLILQNGIEKDTHQEQLHYVNIAFNFYNISSLLQKSMEQILRKLKLNKQETLDPVNSISFVEEVFMRKENIMKSLIISM